MKLMKIKLNHFANLNTLSNEETVILVNKLNLSSASLNCFFPTHYFLDNKQQSILIIDTDNLYFKCIRYGECVFFRDIETATLFLV